MTDDLDQGAEIRETDVVFECPYCTKSLVIDYHGAGLTVQCTDCGRNVEVPIPEGMELFDLDSSAEDQEIRILNLRRALASAETRINQLENELDVIREELALHPAIADGGIDSVLKKAQLIHKVQTEILATLDNIASEHDAD